MTARELRELLGPDVVLLGWPLGSKGTEKPWGHLTAKDMTPKYLKSLDGGNIGVALGRVSGGLVVLDCDIDTLVLRYTEANPSWNSTLTTRGARGAAFWLKLPGDYPAVLKYLKTHAGEDAGEWRAGTNCQQIIYGIHPDTCHPYEMPTRAKPLVGDFASIVWPEEIANPPRLATSQPALLPRNVTQLHSYTALQAVARALPLPSTEQVSTGHVQALVAPCSCVTEAELEPPVMLCSCVTLTDLESLVRVAVPTRPHANHHLVWILARVVKGLERDGGGRATREQLLEIFNCWYGRSLPFLKPGQTRDAYLLEFMQAYQKAKLPLDENGLTAAWKLAQQKPYPPEAIAVFKDEKFRLIVGFCRELQINAGEDPFPLSCRSLAKLLDEKNPMACWRYLKGLCAMGFIQVVNKGTEGPNGNAAEYRYKGPLA